MSKCPNCGAEFEGDYCTYCGVPAKNSIPSPNPQQNNYSNPQGYQQNPYSQQNPYTQQINNYNMENRKITSTGAWFGWQLLESFLPLIGIIIMLCASDDESVKNYAKARLIWSAIALGLIILIFVIIGASAASLSSLNY